MRDCCGRGSPGRLRGLSDAVPTDPRLPWVQPGFLDEARTWIAGRVEVTGEIEQPHVRWWSTVMRVPTAEGDLWFKASAPPHEFEARLLTILERVRPGSVPELVAHDPERGWLLERDGGERLRELDSSLDRWEELLPEYAQLQLALAPHVGELLTAGVPDERLAVLPAHFESLLDDREACGDLTAEEYAAVRALVPRFGESCERLAGFGIPETIQHDDLHDGNVFGREGRYVFFDWGDSCVSHPFHTLVVTFRALAQRLGLPPGGPELIRLRDAYLEPFGSPAELAEPVELAHFTGTAGRALAWHRFVSVRPPEFRADDAEAVAYGLRRLLDLGPLGSW